MNRYINTISNRLSLRAPQRRSLEILAQITDIIELKKDIDIASALNTLQKEFPTITDFERSFPSVCFALATGVGKTRLMGAFITYLHLVHGVENFFVLAPGLTIYNKLITDFTPGTAKYVFKGVAEFAVTHPTVITGDTYNELAGTLFDSLVSCRINVFNISKINSEVRGGKVPKIKQLSEYIGQSYFDFLAGLPDLVMLMDESHRYRATAGIRAINELKPILGLELTATPYVESNKGAIAFNNIVYDYRLSQAMKDGFVKEPAVVTRKDFNASNMTSEAVEEMKLSDGIVLHEKIKVELNTYALETENKIVKPFLLVIARDTTHASQLMKKIQSEQFYDGSYKDKVIQVDSSTKEEEVIERLLKVEDANEPTEIVIHVNMLKEGWDVNNLYTIVPLRAANARTLIEQSIGRGLRLPYGKRTGVSEVDTLNIIAHDKFQEIIDEARKPDSSIILKSIILDTSSLAKKTITVISQTILNNSLGTSSMLTEKQLKETSLDFQPQELHIAQATYEVIRSLENKPDLVPSTAFLQKPKIKKIIVDAVLAMQMPNYKELEIDNKLNIEEIVSNTIEYVQKYSIDIPNILQVPKGNMQVNFQPFNLKFRDLEFKSVSDDLWIQSLRTGELHTISLHETANRKYHLEDLIVESLTEFNDISYENHADLLYGLAKQFVEHFRISFSDEDIDKILKVHRKTIADNIHEQMLEHTMDTAIDGFEVKINKGFSDLKSSAYTSGVAEYPVNYKIAPKDKNNISKYLYGGFSRCLYNVQKFDSNQERILAIILERESQKWFRPANGQFPIYYRKGGEYGQYEPDFVAETESAIYMLECKDKSELNDPSVIAKKDSAVQWCIQASNYSTKNGGKPWTYALIPHYVISENKTLLGLINEYAILGLINNTYPLF